MIEQQIGDGREKRIAVARTWLKQYVIDLDWCRPLRRMAAPFTNSDNQIDWERFSRIVDIKDYYDMPDEAAEIVASQEYLEYLFHIGSGETDFPASRLLIMPDTPTNPAFAEVCAAVTQNAFLALSYGPGISLSQNLLIRYGETQGAPQSELDEIFDLPVDDLVTRVVAKYFNFATFFANPIALDEVDVENPRGPLWRSQVLSHGPLNIIQLIDMTRAIQMQDKNVKESQNKNTESARKLTIEGYQASIRGLRRAAGLI